SRRRRLAPGLRGRGDTPPRGPGSRARTEGPASSGGCRRHRGLAASPPRSFVIILTSSCRCPASAFLARQPSKAFRDAALEPIAQPLRAVAQRALRDAEGFCEAPAAVDAGPSLRDVVAQDQVSAVRRELGEAAIEAAVQGVLLRLPCRAAADVRERSPMRVGPPR